MRMLLFPVGVGLALLACGEGRSDDVDAALITDGGATSSDAALQIDGGEGGGLPSMCTGDCTVMALTAQFGEVTRTFDRAFFGLISPTKSDSGDWEFYIENGSGDDTECPSESSPTPNFLLIVSGIPGSQIVETVIPGATTLVDFEGALLPDTTFSRASASTIDWVAADPCFACAEGTETDRPDRMIAVEIDATFASGTVLGHAFATHCDSLDDL